jgi:hypothetical protein
LRADLSILGEKNRFTGVKYPLKKLFFKKVFFFANLGMLPILKAIKRPEEHVMERHGRSSLYGLNLRVRYMYHQSDMPHVLARHIATRNLMSGQLCNVAPTLGVQRT